MYRYDDHDDPPIEPYDWNDPSPPESLEVVTESVTRDIELLKERGLVAETEEGHLITDAGYQLVALQLRILVESSFELFRHWVMTERPDPDKVGNGIEFMRWLVEQWDSHGLA